jgi:hypothetical protein
VRRNPTFFFLFFGGAALGTFPCPDTLAHWQSGEASLGDCRAAEKQKEDSGGSLGYKQATPTGLQSRSLDGATSPRVETPMSCCEAIPPKMCVMTRRKRGAPTAQD